MEKQIDIRSSLYDYSVRFVDDFENVIKEFGDTTMYVIDRNVYSLYHNKLSHIDNNKVYFVDATEEAKQMETVMDIVFTWKKKEMRKNWKVVCIGGGITQDVTTFASNIFLRNVDWYFIPTTLLSMCDSCIGGKCGINLGEFKNQLGVFYPPKCIYIDTAFLETLGRGDYINGWGELLKFSLTENEAFYLELESEETYIPNERIAEYIYKGLMVKKTIIEEDEFEGDKRRLLNYGHTFGHALEAFTKHAIPHGTAVIWGIDVVGYIAYREGICSEEDYLRVKKLIKNAFLPEEIIVDKPNELFGILSSDKKVKNNMVYLVLPRELGCLDIVPMSLDDKLKGLFVDYLEETHDYYSC